MNKNNRIISLACGIGLLAAMSVAAEELPVRINGFASAGFVTGDLDAPLISGTDIIGKSATFGADNTISIQVMADMNEQVSFTGQLLAKGVIDAYNLEAHWAFVDYHPNHDFSIRAGRLVLPIAMVSEYVDVGYAYPWIRPPVEVYSGIPITSYSGVDILYSLDFGDASLIFQPYVGSVPPSSSAGLDLDVELGAGLNTTLQFEYGSVRAHVMTVKNATGTDEAGSFSFGMDVQILALGADLEFGNVVFISEYMKKEFEFTGLEPYTEVDGEAWFVTLGYRMGKFLPHITFAGADSGVDQVSALDVALGQMMANPDFQTLVAGLSPTEQQVLMADPVAALSSNPALVGQLVTAGIVTPSELQALPTLAGIQVPPAPLAYKQESITLGLRYEILPRTAIKFEYQEIEPQKESWGLFTQEPEDKVKLFSFAIDVTF